MKRLDFLFQVDVVGFEPGIQLLNHGDVGAKRPVVALALQPGTEDLGNELQPLDERRRPASREPHAVNHQGADHFPGGRCRDAQEGTRSGATCLLPQGHGLHREFFRPRDGHQLAAREALDEPFVDDRCPALPAGRVRGRRAIHVGDGSLAGELDQLAPVGASLGSDLLERLGNHLRDAFGAHTGQAS